ncbi:Collagen Alpha-5(Vi) Chain, partial [Manis pentadactyla]
MMLRAGRQGRGAGTVGVGGARDAPSAARRSPGGWARVPTARHAGAREATPASRAAAGSTAGGSRAPGLPPPRARCSDRPARRAPRGGRTPLRTWGAPDTAPGCAGPARMPPIPGAGPWLPAPRPARGAAGGRSPASQRGLPGRSGPARRAPPGGLQLSGFPRGLSPGLLPPPPPQARSTRAGAAAARALPRSGDVRPLLDSINALEEASQCLTLLQPSLLLLTDTRVSRKEDERRGRSSGIWLFRSAGKQGVPGRT